MTASMLEKVARAIYEGRNGRGSIPWARLPKAHQAPYLADARAALEAMREPTQAMKQAAAIPVGNYDIAHDALVRAIDAALSEDAKEG